MADTPLFTDISNRTLKIPYATSVIVLVLISFTLTVGRMFGVSSAALSFFLLGTTYTTTTISLSSHNTVVLFCEIFLFTLVVELIYQMNYEKIAWLVVFLLPTVTSVQSLFYLMYIPYIPNPNPNPNLT